MTTLEINTVSKAMQQSKILLDQIKPVLDQLDVIYNSSGGAGSTITQNGLDAILSFSGLTKQQLDDAMYVLTTTLRPNIANAFTQLAQLATRA